MTRRTRTSTRAADAAPTLSRIPPADVLGRLAALNSASTPELKEQWRALFGTDAPPYGRRMLEGRLAYRIQELAYGGLKPETVARLEALGEQLDGRNVVLRRIRRDDRPIAGTRLIREYQGIAINQPIMRNHSTSCTAPTPVRWMSLCNQSTTVIVGHHVRTRLTNG